MGYKQFRDDLTEAELAEYEALPQNADDSKFRIEHDDGCACDGCRADRHQDRCHYALNHK